MLFAARLLIATCAVGVAVATAAAQKSSEPQLVVEVKPDYTPEARAAGIEGSVLLLAEVLADGNVGDVRVVRSLDATYGLDNEAVKALKQWIFKPAMKDGEPVTMSIHVEMFFSLKNE